MEILAHVAVKNTENMMMLISLSILHLTQFLLTLILSLHICMKNKTVGGLPWWSCS